MAELQWNGCQFCLQHARSISVHDSTCKWSNDETYPGNLISHLQTPIQFSPDLSCLFVQIIQLHPPPPPPPHTHTHTHTHKHKHKHKHKVILVTIELPHTNTNLYISRSQLIKSDPFTAFLHHICDIIGVTRGQIKQVKGHPNPVSINTTVPYYSKIKTDKRNFH